MQLARTPDIVFPLILLLAGAMGWIQAPGFCVLVLAWLLANLITGRLVPEGAVPGALILLLVGSAIMPGKGFLSLEVALQGFGNPIVATIAALFIIAYAIRTTGFLDRVAQWVLGSTPNGAKVLTRMASPLMGLSAVLNNTPIVAIFMPLVRNWAIQHSLSPSKILLPMAYLTGFGGLLTIIGNSTTLVVDGIAQTYDGVQPMGFFDVAWVGLPCALLGVGYLILFSDKLLPARSDILENTKQAWPQRIFQLRVEPNSPLVGHTIMKSGIREIHGVFLFKVQRGQDIVAPVTGHFRLQSGDVLSFSGKLDSETQGAFDSLGGLSPVEGQEEINIGQEAQMLEVLISPTSSLIGKTLDQVWFNRTYDAAVLAIQRNGEVLQDHFSTVPLRTGDTLILLAGLGFRRIWQESGEFLLVTPRRDDLAKSNKTSLCLALVAGVVVFTIFSGLTVHYAALLLAFLLVLTQCVEPNKFLQVVDWRVIAIIGASFGLSAALSKSGASGVIANWLLDLAPGQHVLITLLLVYLLTNLITELLTNNASAAIMLPLAMTIAHTLGANPQPFIMTVAIAASASFATPIGYQTNLLVFGPGGYRYMDYLKIGLPLNALFCAGALLIIPRVWPL